MKMAIGKSFKDRDWLGAGCAMCARRHWSSRFDRQLCNVPVWETVHSSPKDSVQRTEKLGKDKFHGSFYDD